MLEKMGVKVELEQVKKIMERGDMIVAKVKEMEQKIEIMRNKRKLGGEKQIVKNDLTEREREMQ